MSASFRAGYVALAGRPNVGKSTLLNALVGAHISIVTQRPQTTRHRVLGISTRPGGQLAYLDTPGLHRAEKRALNRAMNRAARGALAEAQAVALVIEAGRWLDEDQDVYAAIAAVGVPCVLAVNKIDRTAEKAKLLPFLAEVATGRRFAAIVPVSALRRDGLDRLEQELLALLPVSPPLYEDDELTDRSERFLAAELVREQLMRQLGAELPYACTVEIERFEDEDGLSRIAAVIWVEREGQKAIVIGESGERLKRIGQSARMAMERLFGRKVFLQLWCKVRERWSDDEAALRRFGYGE
ncbi:MAG TPA: GTPase Era [Xanthomonadaceae bacterium]|nr:GTPase Era [Xanthomonadaceae bacterium]